MGNASKPIFDKAAAEDFLDFQRMNIRLNELTHEFEVSGLPEEYKADELNCFFTLAYDTVRQTCSTTRAHSDDLFKLIGTSRSYNPIQEKLLSVVPDGKDRFADLLDILGIPADDVLSRALIHKWCLQCVALLYNGEAHPCSADGLLVLVGGQGIGKTSIVAQLGGGSRYCKLGLSVDPRNKDSLIAATTCWIGEIAELESTLRGDLQMLKAFLTADFDEVRRPYDRYSTRVPRRTSYIGTVNSTDFLIDETGNRRFWTIPLTKIDLERLRKFDAWQLWKQVEMEFSGYVLQHTSDSCFRLTAEEQRLLAERNSCHEKQLPAEQELRDILGAFSDNPNYRLVWTTVTEFKECFAELKPYSSAKLSKALDKLGISAERRRINGAVVRARQLPLPKCVATNWQKSENVNSVYSL